MSSVTYTTNFNFTKFPKGYTSWDAGINENFDKIDQVMGEINSTYQGAIKWSSVTEKPTTLAGYGVVDAVATTSVGQANGVVPLGSDRRISAEYLPDAILGALSWQGNWNATTNSPQIPAATNSNKGHYYIVGTSGNTTIPSAGNDWEVGDWIISSGTAWQKIDNSDKVVRVNGESGDVTLTTAHISEVSNLYFTNARTISSTLTGLSIASGGSVTSSDDILTAIGKLEYRTAINDAKVSFTGSVAWGSVTGKPTAFTPSSHASTHSPQGSDNIFPANAAGTLLNNGSGVLSWGAAYTHPSGDGNLHVPVNGATNNNKVLKATATPGSYTWGSVAYNEITGVPSTFAPSAHTSTHAPGGSDSVFPANSIGYLRNDGSGNISWVSVSSSGTIDSLVPQAASTSTGLTLNSTSQASNFAFTINAGAGVDHPLVMSRNGVVCWKLSGTDNVSSRFYLSAHDDSGNFIDNVFMIPRPAGSGIAVSRPVAIGSSAPYTSSSMLSIGGSTTGTSFAFAAAMQTSVTASSGTVYGIWTNFTLAPAGGAQASAFEMNARVQTGTATTVLAATAHYANLTKLGTGTITTAYGIQIAPINVGTTNYAIYTNAGRVRFGDDVSTTGGMTVMGLTQCNVGGQALQLGPGTQDHTFIAFCPRTASPSARRAYVGFGSGGSNILSVVNEIAAGEIRIATSGGTGPITLSGNVAVLGTLSVGGQTLADSHNHNAAYLGLTAKASDSSKLDGVTPSALGKQVASVADAPALLALTGGAAAGHGHGATYLGINEKAVDSSKLDGTTPSILGKQVVTAVDSAALLALSGGATAAHTHASGDVTGLSAFATLAMPANDSKLYAVKNGATTIIKTITSRSFYCETALSTSDIHPMWFPPSAGSIVKISHCRNNTTAPTVAGVLKLRKWVSGTPSDIATVNIGTADGNRLPITDSTTPIALSSTDGIDLYTFTTGTGCQNIIVQIDFVTEAQ